MKKISIIFLIASSLLLVACKDEDSTQTIVFSAKFCESILRHCSDNGGSFNLDEYYCVFNYYQKAFWTACKNMLTDLIGENPDNSP